MVFLALLPGDRQPRPRARACLPPQPTSGKISNTHTKFPSNDPYRLWILPFPVLRNLPVEVARLYDRRSKSSSICVVREQVVTCVLKVGYPVSHCVASLLADPVYRVTNTGPGRGNSSLPPTHPPTSRPAHSPSTPAHPVSRSQLVPPPSYDRSLVKTLAAAFVWSPVVN